MRGSLLQMANRIFFRSLGKGRGAEHIPDAVMSVGLLGRLFRMYIAGSASRIIAMVSAAFTTGLERHTLRPAG